MDAHGDPLVCSVRFLSILLRAVTLPLENLSNLMCMLMATPRYAASGLLADCIFDFCAVTLTLENLSGPGSDLDLGKFVQPSLFKFDVPAHGDP